MDFVIFRQTHRSDGQCSFHGPKSLFLESVRFFHDITIFKCGFGLEQKLYWLVVLTILKNLSSSMGRIIPYMKWKKNVWNHQSAIHVLIWVNYHISLTWIVRPFGDDSPKINHDSQWGRTVRSWSNLPRLMASKPQLNFRKK